MSAAPKVSVIVPNYNHAPYLAPRLESVYGQTFRDCEVILLDDCSSDASREILERFPKTLPTRCAFNGANSGSPFRQWLKGLALARGEYVWIAESDDFCDPRLLERLVGVLDAAPEAALAFCQSRLVDGEGTFRGIYTEEIKLRQAKRYRADFGNDGTDECVRFLSQQNFIPNASAVLFRRRLTEGAGPLIEGMRYVGDWRLYMHLLLQGEIRFVAEPLNSYRLHATNQTFSERSLFNSFPERVRGVGWLARRVPMPYFSLMLACNQLLSHGSLISRWISREGVRQLGFIHREGAIPWHVLLPSFCYGVFRWVLRRILRVFGIRF